MPVPPDTRQLLIDEKAPEAHEPGMTFYEVGPNAGGVAPQSTKVGWTLRNRATNDIEAAFAFLINPQGLTRVDGSRSSVQATKGRVYVDHFGRAPVQISMRQLVASGKVIDSGFFFTQREDVQRWFKTIYLPATQGAGARKYRVLFHDHHYERGMEEEVWFPPQSHVLERSVELHNVWKLDVQMVSLEQYPYSDVEISDAPPRVQKGRRYMVKVGDTLTNIVARLAGKGASATKRRRTLNHLLALNPSIKKRRTLANGNTGKPMKVYPGEVLLLPAGGDTPMGTITGTTTVVGQEF